MPSKQSGRLLKLCGCYLMAAVMTATGWLYSRLPDHICVEQGESLTLARYTYLKPLQPTGVQDVLSTDVVGSFNTTFALGGVIPIRTVRTVITERPTVRVSGAPFGVKMFSEGAMVVGFTDLPMMGGNANPAKESGLRLGDRIIRMNDVPVNGNDELKSVLETCAGADIEMIFIRSGEQHRAVLHPIQDETGGYRAGMWVRDSSAGVGTLTFSEEETEIFAGLGHAINDGDTGESIALRSGEIVPCEIVGWHAGTIGSPGELKGQFLAEPAIGTIEINGEEGVYGVLREEIPGWEREVSFAQEVVPGEGELWTTIQGQEPRAYKIRIEHVSDVDPLRSMVIRVIDEDLLRQTGGIVQGMSGSPILQNGRFVGAVTHVLVNDPARGYGIFAETMLEQADRLAEHLR